MTVKCNTVCRSHPEGYFNEDDSDAEAEDSKWGARGLAPAPAPAPITARLKRAAAAEDSDEDGAAAGMKTVIGSNAKHSGNMDFGPDCDDDNGEGAAPGANSAPAKKRRVVVDSDDD